MYFLIKKMFFDFYFHNFIKSATINPRARLPQLDERQRRHHRVIEGVVGLVLGKAWLQQRLPQVACHRVDTLRVNS